MTTHDSRPLHAVALGAALFVTATALLALLGVLEGIHWMESLVPGLVNMKVNTALGLAAGGIALGLLAAGRRPPPEDGPAEWRRVAAGAIGVALFLLGALTLGQDLFGWNLGIDEAIRADRAGAVATGHPGRMSPATAGGFILVGAALLLVPDRRRRLWIAGQVLTLAALAVALLTLVGYAYGERSLYRLEPFTAMALNTAIAFLVLTLGLLAAPPTRGLAAVATDETAGGRSLRGLLPMALGVVFGLGALRVGGERLGLYDSTFGTAAFVLATMVLLAILIGRHAILLRHSDLALRAEREWFAVTLSSIGDAVITTDTEARVTFLNHVAARLLARPQEEVVGRPLGEVFRLVAESDGRPVDDPVDRVLAEGVVLGLGNGTLLVDGNGEEIPIDDSAAPIRSADGEVLGAVLVFRDQTQRRESQRALIESERQFRRSIVEAPIPVLLHAEDGEILQVSRTLTELTGYLPEDLGSYDRWLELAFGADRAEEAAATIARFDRGDAAPPVELPVRTRSGEEHTWRFNVSAPGRLHDGRRYLAVMATDLTEIRAAERRKDEFLAMLAHELRNPLAAVASGVALLDQSETTERRDWLQTMMRRQVEHLTRLIDDLLDVSRITRGKIELRRQHVLVSEAVERALAAVDDAVRARHHRLEVDLPDERLVVHADPTRLEQVLVNLLTNAAKYTPEGGRIVLVAERDPGDREQVVVRVRDNGVGIASEQLDRVFDLFAQGRTTLDRSDGGLGIGLTLVRKLVELHGGTVTVASDGPGRGSEFLVRLPLVESAEAAPEAARGSGATNGGRPLRVLVVDDTPDVAESFALLLGHAGHDTEVAADGHQALEAARRLRPDVVFLDIGLPGLDGYQVAERLRADPATADALLIAVSGYGQQEDLERSRAAGFARHFVKPVDYRQVLALLSRQDAGTPS